jgi:DNA-binding beta-propeller fold protein YncE
VDRRRFLLVGASAALALGADPWARAARRGDAAVAFVTADLESHVVVVSLSSGRTLGHIATAAGPRSIESVHGRAAIVAHTQHGLVSIVDAVAREVRAELDSFSAPRYTAVHPAKAIAYVTDSMAEEVVVVDVARARVLARTRVPGPARHASVSRDGRTLWTALGSKAELLALLDLGNPTRPRLERTLTTPMLAHDVVFAPDGEHAWVTSGAGHRIVLYRAETREVVSVLAADRAPQHIVFVGDLAFVSSGDDGTVRVCRSNGDLVHAASVPIGSYNVTFGSGRAVSPSLSRGTVALLDQHGHVRAVRTVAKAAHDACIVHVA